MSTYIGLEFQSHHLNYAEVSTQQRTLLQLGTCTFSFDAEQAFFDEKCPQLYIDEINRALIDIFRFSEATEVRFSLHPKFTTLFYTPVGIELSIQDRAKQFLQEARQLSGKNAKPLHIVPVPLFIEDVAANDGVIWYQIMAVDKHLFNQSARILKGISAQIYKFQSVSTDIARLVALQTAETPKPEAPFMLSIGCFGTHTEIMVCRKENLHFTYWDYHQQSLSAQIQTALKQMSLNNAALHRVYVYGSAIPSDLSAVLGQQLQVRVEALDILAPLFDVQHQDAPQFAVCLSAAL